LNDDTRAALNQIRQVQGTGRNGEAENDNHPQQYQQWRDRNDAFPLKVKRSRAE
jgi:transcription initiation factor TFIID subunit TAF12